MGKAKVTRPTPSKADELRQRTALRRKIEIDNSPHYIALRMRGLAALIGSYNAYGIRRWFGRPRRALDDATPTQALAQADSEDDERLQRVVRLADELTGAAAAA